MCAARQKLSRVERFTKGPRMYKYTAWMRDGSKVHFGHADYEQYRDAVPVSLGGGLWTHKDHRDAKRRERYRARHRGVRTKSGRPAYRVKYSPSWFSYHFLW